MDLVEFLSARIDEDEAAAREMIGDTPPTMYPAIDFDGPCFVSVHESDGDHLTIGAGRVLREVAAKRAILALLSLGPDTWDYESNANPENAMHEIRREHDYELAYLLATVYADHPDYRAEWQPA